MQGLRSHQSSPIALACWPKNERRRGHALVTWAAQINAINEGMIPGPDRVGAIDSGVFIPSLPSPGSWASRPRSCSGFHLFERWLKHKPARSLTKLGQLSRSSYSAAEEVGYPSLMPRIRAVSAMLFSRRSKSGDVAGRVLLYCARLNRHHPGMTAGGQACNGTSSIIFMPRASCKQLPTEIAMVHGLTGAVSVQFGPPCA